MTVQNPQALKAVYKAMLALFTEEKALRSFTLLHLEERVDNLAAPGKLPDRILEVVESRDAASKLPDLAKALFDAFPNRAELAPLVPLFPDAAPAPANAVAAQIPCPRRLYESQYVIDRDDVWRRLDRMSSTTPPVEEMDPNVLLVTGGARAGKSLVADLVAHLARRRKQRHLETKFEQIVPDPVALAKDWLDEINPTLSAAQHVTVNYDPTNLSGQPGAAALSVLKALRYTTDPWWIVFDGPKSTSDSKGQSVHTAIPDSLMKFFDVLCDKVAVSYSHVRLVLIGVDESRLPSRRRAGVEQVAAVAFRDVERFFEHVCAHRTPPADPGVPKRIAELVWASVPDSCAGQVERVHDAVLRALRKLATKAGEP